MTCVRRLAVVVLIVSVATACGSEPRVFRQEPAVLPDVVGLPVTEARGELADLGHIVRLVEDGSDEVVECPDGEVVAQDPPPEQEVLPATTVTLTVDGCVPEGGG